MKDRTSIFELALKISAILAFEIFNLEKLVKVVNYNFHNGDIRWQISNSIKLVAQILSLAFIVSKIFEMFDLDKVGQGQRV